MKYDPKTNLCRRKVLCKAFKTGDLWLLAVVLNQRLKSTLETCFILYLNCRIQEVKDSCKDKTGMNAFERGHIFLSEDIWTPLTALATRETLYLLREDHQWRKSSNSLTVNENKEPCSGSLTVLETLPISCVSSVHLWPSDECRMDIKLYDEVSVQHVTGLDSAASTVRQRQDAKHRHRL